MCGNIKTRSNSLPLPQMQKIITNNENIKSTQGGNLFTDETKKNAPNKSLFENRNRSNTSLQASVGDLDFINDSIQDIDDLPSIDRERGLTQILESPIEELAEKGLVETNKPEIEEDGFVIVNGNEIKETKDELKKELIDSIKEINKAANINTKNQLTVDTVFGVSNLLDKIINLDGKKEVSLVSAKSIDSFLKSIDLLSTQNSDYNSIDNNKFLHQLNQQKNEMSKIFENKDSYKLEFNSQIKSLNLGKTNEDKLNNLYKSFYEQHDELYKQIEQKIESIKNTDLPTSKKEIGEFKSLWNKTAIDTSSKLRNEIMGLGFDKYDKNKTGIKEDDKPLINTLEHGKQIHDIKQKVCDALLNSEKTLSKRQNEIKSEFIDTKDNKILSKKEIQDLMGNKKAGMFAKIGAKSKTVEQLKNGNLRVSSKNFQDRELLEVTLKQSVKHAEKQLDSELKSFRKALETSGGIEGKKYSPKEINKLIDTIRQETLNVLYKSKPKAMLQEQYTQNLNQKEWNVIEKNVSYNKKDGTNVSVQSTMTPASKIFEKLDTDVKYNGIGGVSCFDRGRPDHAVNLWKSELKSQDGKELFKGLRHGINSAFTIKDKDERKSANNERSREIVLSALLSNKDILEKAMNRKAGEEEPVLNLPSVSLVTPTALRGKISALVGMYDKEHDEGMMLKDQAESWDNIKNTIMSFNIDGKDVLVKVNPIQFNFGVNAGAVSSLSSVVGGWSESNKYNEKAMEELLGYKPGKKALKPINGGIIGEYEANLIKDINKHKNQPEIRAGLEKKHKQITKIAEQIKQIWDSGSYKADNHDAYKMPVRLLALSHLTENIPAYNCKSGKDRTSQVDVEVKNFLTQLEFDSTVQGFGLKKDDKFKKNFANFAIDAGNFEIQKANVGAGGFKLSGVDSLKERIGGKENQRIQQGLGKYNKA